MVPQHSLKLSECAIFVFSLKERAIPHQYCVRSRFGGVDHGQFIHMI